MIKINTLYQALQEENKYNNLDEKLIFSQLYQIAEGSIETAVSHIINQAVLSHIHLDIDSTIMQMLVLNNYLTQLFMKNFVILMNNYILYYLENHGIGELKEQDVKVVEHMVSQIKLDTEFQKLISKINSKWHL